MGWVGVNDKSNQIKSNLSDDSHTYIISCKLVRHLHSTQDETRCLQPQHSLQACGCAWTLAGLGVYTVFPRRRIDA